MKRVLELVTIIVASVCLTSCLVPEKFTATLHIDKAKNFRFTYNGTVAFPTALGDIQKHQKISPGTEAQMKDGETQLHKVPEYKRMEYLGNGRYKIQFESSGLIESNKMIFNGVGFKVEKDGQIRMCCGAPPDVIKALSELNVQLEGTLKVTSDLTVVKHNASSTPMLNGRVSAYVWNVSLNKDEWPTIVFQP